MTNELRQGDATVLGLDLGANSLGWALIQLSDGRPCGLLEGGVRVFPAGVDGVLETGRDEPRTVQRRQARQARRQLFRRRQRRRRLFRALQRGGLLPATEDDSPETINTTIQRLDQQLRAALPAADHRQAQLLPYRLRTLALTEALEPFALGRALYHLNQRRGFKSNRREQRDEDERGTVKTDIAELERAMAQAQAPTLGAYLATLDPTDDRVRKRWTARSMYENEFNAILDAQTPHHPTRLTEAFRRELHRILFFQRPLKSQRHLIGTCELEPGRRRAPAASLLYQRFRLLQTVNNLLIEPSEREQLPLDDAQRSTLIEALMTRGDLTFAKVRSLLDLKRTVKFNLERGGEKKLPGDRVSSALAPLMGAAWETRTTAQREALVDELLGFEDEAALARRAQSAWGLDDAAARDVARLRLESGYARHSRQALQRLLPALEAGTAYATARKDHYPEAWSSTDPLDRVPPLTDASSVRDLTNPAVARSLTELRRVVNAIIAEHGKPDLIRLELARDLKRGRRDRQAMATANRARQGHRDKIKETLLREQGLTAPSRRDLEKALLAEECGMMCPYTGKPISWEALFGPHPQFDIEHIIPLSMSLDDSFLNKTLCYHEENRHRKANRTPWQAYGGTPQFEQILDRVANFTGDAVQAKLWRFRDDAVAEDLLERFSSRQLNDTRYATTLAMDYLGELYGGVVDTGGVRRIRACAGGVTAHLRRQWGLENLLGEGERKSRDDHRHHLVDAVVVGLANESAIRDLAHAAQDAEAAGAHRRFLEMPPPWPSLRDDLQDLLAEVTVSHRVDRRLGGAFHEETLYSPPRPDGAHVVRKPVTDLSAGDVDAIVDPAVRAAVRTALESAGTGHPKTAFKDPAARPSLPGKRGPTPIKSVRIRKNVATATIGDGVFRRHVKPGSNHHMAIVQISPTPGKTPKLEFHIVSRLEANLRKQRGEPVIQREWGADRTFLFSLRSGDSIRMKDDEGADATFLVRTISGKTIELSHVDDARPKTEINKAGRKGGRITLSPKSLREREAKKVSVDPLGRVRRAHD